MFNFHFPLVGFRTGSFRADPDGDMFSSWGLQVNCVCMYIMYMYVVFMKFKIHSNMYIVIH